MLCIVIAATTTVPIESGLHDDQEAHLPLFFNLEYLFGTADIRQSNNSTLLATTQITINTTPTMVPWSSHPSTGRPTGQLGVAPPRSGARSSHTRTSNNQNNSIHHHLGSSATMMSDPTIRTSLNGPNSPPVLFNPSATAAAAEWDEEEDERCRACHAAALYTDWAQGDRVCTNCGVVAEGHLRDIRPEWKDFNEAEDIVRGLPSGARSGLVAVDESKYVGGLQPTTLSKHAFGGDSHGGYGMARMRKRLKTTNKRLDYMMEKIHSNALKDAKLDRRIRLKRSRNQQDVLHNDDSIRPELEHVILQEEEDAHRLQTALYAEKWSLDRALLLYGQDHEQREVTDEEREELMGKLDSILRKASNDLYTAYSMLSQAATALQLPERVLSESVHRLVRFVTLKDGVRIPGVASRLSHDSVGSSSQIEQKEMVKQLKEYNLRKQMAALGGALLFLTARSLGWTRCIAEICSSFTKNNQIQVNEKSKKKAPAFIKAKHVSRAMKEIQSLFPEYGKYHTIMQSATSDLPSTTVIQDANATANFADHSLRKLQLPPVAEACIRTLLIQLRDEQLTLGRYSGTKLSTICASLAYLICTAGSLMQRLARQHRNSLHNKPASASFPPRKKQKAIKVEAKKEHTAMVPKAKTEIGSNSSSDSDDDDDELLGPANSRLKTDDDDVPFDVFSHAAIMGDQTEKQQYELKRMWDAWAEQMCWARSIVDLEQSCGVSRSVIHEFYKKELYERRAELLECLSESVKEPLSREKDPQSLHEAPLASILLAHISTAGAVMTPR